MEGRLSTIQLRKAIISSWIRVADQYSGMKKFLRRCNPALDTAIDDERAAVSRSLFVDTASFQDTSKNQREQADFLPHNYYIKGGKLVIFDTEPMSLIPLSLLCVSPTLRVARINFKNLERNFTNIPEAKILVDKAKRSINQIRAQEREKFPRAVCITLVFLGAMVLLNYFALLPLRVEYNGKGITITI